MDKIDNTKKAWGEWLHMSTGMKSLIMLFVPVCFVLAYPTIYRKYFADESIKGLISDVCKKN